MSKYFAIIYQSNLSKLKELPKGSILTFMALAMYANKKRQCWPAQSTLAKDTGLSVRGLQKALNTLKDAGLVEVQRMGMKKPNIYTLSDAHFLDSDTHFSQSDAHFSQSDAHFSQSDANSGVRTNRSLEQIIRTNQLEEHCSSSSLYENEFLSFFGKWKSNQHTQWKSKNALEEWKKIQSFAAGDLDLLLELKCVDAWLTKDICTGTGKAWTGRVWSSKLKHWLKSQTTRSGGMPAHLRPYKGIDAAPPAPPAPPVAAVAPPPTINRTIPAELNPIMQSLKIHQIHWLQSVEIYQSNWHDYQLSPDTLAFLGEAKQDRSLDDHQRSLFGGILALFCSY